MAPFALKLISRLLLMEKSLLTVVFMCGFAVMGLEILGSRILFPFFGSSVEVWGALISVFLAGLSAGYALGGRIADARPETGCLRILILAPAVLVMLFPLYGRGVCHIFASLSLDVKWAALLASSCLFAIPCIFSGAVIPFAVKLLVDDDKRVGAVSGSVYASSTAGSIAGTLFTSFYLIGWMTVMSGIVLLGFIFIAAWIILEIGMRLAIGKRQ